jgi:hypothetical protein
MFPQTVYISFASEIEVSSVRIESRFVHKLRVITAEAAGAQELVLAQAEYPHDTEGSWQTRDIPVETQGKRGVPVKTQGLQITIGSGHGDFVALRRVSVQGTVANPGQG